MIGTALAIFYTISATVLTVVFWGYIDREFRKDYTPTIELNFIFGGAVMFGPVLGLVWVILTLPL